MNRFTYICLKIVWWSSWPLLLVLLCFFLTGYCMSGRFGLTRLMAADTALAWHKLLHLPLLLLVVVHTVPATYIALRRWGWIKPSAALKLDPAERSTASGRAGEGQR